MFATLTRVGPGPLNKVLGMYRVNPREVATFGPMQDGAVKFATDDAEAQDTQGNAMTEILLTTGQVMFVLETHNEVARALEGRV